MSIGVMAVYWMVSCINGNYEHRLRMCEKEAWNFVYITRWTSDSEPGIIPYRSAQDQIYALYRK